MERVVITGMGAITPIGNDCPRFWDGLVQGRCGIGPITRFDASGHKVRIAAEVKGFDPLLYMDKDQVRRSDLYTQYALAAAVQAMDNSGLHGKISPERLGVYVGSGIGGMNTFSNESQRLLERGPSRVSALFIPTMIANIAAGVIAIRYGAQGPCLPVVTACATGTHSIGEAYRCIRHGYADAIIAGGAEAAVTPLAVAGFTNCLALSTTNRPLQSSLPFDKRREGFVLGEGAGVLVLESYAHAQARGAHIYGEVLGYGNTCDAHHITAPHPQALSAAAAMKQALAQAQAQADQPYDTIYINAHGTGTPLNDKAETLAIKAALGEGAKTAKISSTKSMTGHMLGAAGAAEAIACVYALQHGLLPPTIGLELPDEDCDLDYVPGRAQHYPAQLALSNSLGFGGHNACIAIGPAPQNSGTGGSAHG